MSGTVSQCPGDDLFRRFLERRLPAQELAALHAHVDQCPDCMALFLELARADAGAPSLEKEQTADGTGPEIAVSGQVEEYRLLRPLGQGAMGQVFLAHDTLLDRPVALKFLSVGAPSEAARERFFVEARAIARLSHPNVVRIYRVAEMGKRPYLVSEMVPGRSLDQISLPLPVEQVIHIGLGIGRGLAAAHQRGILHRDIKLANVILADDGEVKLLDFGLAKLLDTPWPLDTEMETTAESPKKSHALTRTGAVLGTPYYMAPELWRRQAATEQSDLYALGALLYELAAGRPPHQARTLRELLRLVQKKEIPPLREVARGIPRALWELVERCLRKNPQERFQSAEELCRALESLRELEQEPSGARRPLRDRNNRKLRAVQAGHRALCLVRSSEIAAVLHLLQREGLVVVAGDAGVGKSSFCRDALLPAVCEGALRDGRTWSVLALHPGRRPLRSLARVLAPWFQAEPQDLLPRLRSDPAALLHQLRQRHPERTGLLLFIDQLEELSTQSEADEAAAFAELLSELSKGGPIVRTLLAARSEYLSRLAALPGLDSELTRALFLLRPLSAATAFAAARRLHPDQPQLLRKLGAAYRKLGRHDAAAAVLERAVELLPEDARSRRLLALTHSFCGHLEAAVEQARAGARLQPESARAWRLLGRLCLLARDWAQARDALRQAITLQPTHRLAHRWLGEALLASGQAAEAVPCFEKAAELSLARSGRSEPDS